MCCFSIHTEEHVIALLCVTLKRKLLSLTLIRYYANVGICSILKVHGAGFKYGRIILPHLPPSSFSLLVHYGLYPPKALSLSPSVSQGFSGRKRRR
jgi:hypothetical protein